MPTHEIAIKTTDDVRGVQNATEETIKLTDAMGRLLERAERTKEMRAAREQIAALSDEEREAALAAYRLEAAQRQVNNAIDESGAAAHGTAELIGNLRTSWMEMYAAVGLAQQVFQVGQQLWRDTGEKFMELADQTRELQQAIGATAEEASTLIAVADDVQISAESLERAFESAIRRGYEPSIEGLMKMAAEFQSIQDPIQRTKYLVDTFGRTGADLHRLLLLDAEAMRELAAEAERTNQVLTEQQMRIAQGYREALDGLEDELGGFQLGAGEIIAASLTDFMNAAVKYNEALSDHAGLLRFIPGAGAPYLAFLAVQEKQARMTASAQAELNAELNGTASAMERMYNRQGAINPGDPNYRAMQVWMMEGGLASDFPGRASGGPVRGGQPYIINENRPWTGPEVFLAPADGYIYPNAGAAQQAMGGRGGERVVLVDYHPTIGLGDRHEAEQILIPLVKQALRDAK